MNNPITYMIRKEMLEIRRSNLIRILIIAPIIQVIIFGFVATTDIKNVETIICNEDNTAVSRQLVDKFANSEYFRIVKYTHEPSDIDKTFKKNGAIIGIRIPAGFGSNIKKTEKTQVQMIVDGSDSNMSLISMNRASMIIMGFSENVFKDKLEVMKHMIGEVPAIEMQERVWFNPELKSANTMVPGVIGMIVLIVTLVITAVSLVREKESGNIEQIVVTPIKPYQIILGKIIPYALIGLLDIVLVTVTGMVVFSIPFAGNFLLLVFLSLFMILASLGLGILISTVSSTQQQAMLSAMFIMLPNILLSGFVFPIKNMPVILQYVTYFLPLRYYMEIIRGVFLKGVGFMELIPQTVALLIFAVVLFTIAIKKFHKTVS